MTLRFGILIVSLAIGVFTFAGLAQADNDCEKAKIKEVVIGRDGKSHEDMSLKVVYDGKTEDAWLIVRESKHKDRGVDRIHRMAVAALVGGRPVFLCATGDELTRFYLK